MYYKYGLVLRGLPGGHSFLTGLFERVCLGNCYAATREHRRIQPFAATLSPTAIESRESREFTGTRSRQRQR